MQFSEPSGAMQVAWSSNSHNSPVGPTLVGGLEAGTVSAVGPGAGCSVDTGTTGSGGDPGVWPGVGAGLVVAGVGPGTVSAVGPGAGTGAGCSVDAGTIGSGADAAVAQWWVQDWVQWESLLD